MYGLLDATDSSIMNLMGQVFLCTYMMLHQLESAPYVRRTYKKLLVTSTEMEQGRWCDSDCLVQGERSLSVAFSHVRVLLSPHNNSLE